MAARLVGKKKKPGEKRRHYLEDSYSRSFLHFGTQGYPLDESHLRLDTDFRDYYDHLFAHRDSPFPMLNRRSVPVRTRQDDYHLLVSSGIRTPLHGRFFLLANELIELREKPMAVIYFAYLYCTGQGKTLVDVNPDEAFQWKHRSYFASEYHPQPQPISYRYLQIGIGDDAIVRWMRYRSDDDWRSNHGKIDIEDCEDPRTDEQGKGQRIDFGFPLYAVDFIRNTIDPGREDEMLAIDLNTAPGLRWTSIQEEFRGQDIYDRIRVAWYALRQSGRLLDFTPPTFVEHDPSHGQGEGVSHREGDS